MTFIFTYNNNNNFIVPIKGPRRGRVTYKTYTNTYDNFCVMKIKLKIKRILCDKAVRPVKCEGRHFHYTWITPA